MNKKSVYTCETCSALYVCLKFFQEHRKKHANSEGRTIFPCTHCQIVHTSKHESHLHSISHENEPPHSCEVCQEMLGISEEETLGTRRSIGTATDFHVYNLSLDKPIKDEEDEEENDSDEEEDDDEDDDEEEDEEEEGDEEEDETQHKDQHVTNIIYVTNQTINQTTTFKPPRPSRSTGKGKGNRKARLTTDDIRRKFSCCHCGKSFKTKSHLQRHILTHTGEKPYHCNRCDCRFNQSSSLRNHVIAIHTKEYPHTCTNCSKGFLMPAVLQKHLQTSECGRGGQ